MSSCWILEYIIFNILLLLCLISRFETNCRLILLATGGLTFDLEFTTHRLINLQLTTCKLLELQVTNQILFDCNLQTHSPKNWLVESHYFPIGFLLAPALCKLKWNKGKQMFGNNVFFGKKSLDSCYDFRYSFPHSFFPFWLFGMYYFLAQVICKVCVSRHLFWHVDTYGILV